mgnify:CR=1 FL=1
MKTVISVRPVKALSVLKSIGLRLYALAVLVVLIWAGYAAVAYLVRSVFVPNAVPAELGGGVRIVSGFHGHLEPPLQDVEPPDHLGLTDQGVGEPDSESAASPCLVCHGPQGVAPGPATVIGHPAVPLEDIALQEVVLENGSIGCTTCHWPHGEAPQEAENLLRTGIAEGLCARCHVTNSETLHRHYHHPRSRVEP